LHHFINHLFLLVEKQDVFKNRVSDLKTLAKAYDILFYKELNLDSWLALASASLHFWCFESEVLKFAALMKA
jgi:hypothetical protein